MKIPVIRTLVEKYSLEELKNAENAIAEEQQPEIEVEGEDEGEQLTHVYGAIWIKERIENDGVDPKVALREFSARVRNSIS